MKYDSNNRRRGWQNMVMLIAAAALLAAPGASFGAAVPDRESAADPALRRAGPMLVPHRETAEEPNEDRKAPIPSPTLPSSNREAPAAAPSAALAPAASSFGPNLVPNPGLETAGQSGLPANWHKGGYGSSTRAFAYPVPGKSGSGIRVAVSNYSSGDAKWYPDDMPVTGGKTYEFSDSYKSTVASIVTIRFALSSGAFVYKDIITLPASAAYASAAVQFAAPAGAVSATVFHLIKSNGALDTDDYVLREVTPPPPPPSSQNSVPNGDFETAGSGGLPAHWARGGYGSNTRAFAYPVSGQSGNGAQITVSGYASGDAKWVHGQVALPPGAYTYSDSYKASVPTILTAEFQRADGSFFYADLKTLPAASSWTTATAALSVSSSAVKTRVFHLIKSNGTLSIDNVAITPSSASSGIFSTGAVTFRMDDGLGNQYSAAAPMLDAAGFKGTFYIVSRETADNGFPGLMSKAQVQDLAARGHEIGAHTRTHAHLTRLTPQQQQDEIAGSRQDLLGWNVGPMLSFAYPYGEYDATTLQIVRDAGFTSAAATITGYASTNSDPYQLEYQELLNTVTLDQVKQWVDTAAQTRTWLILAFHDIDTSNSLYAVTPGMFQSIVDYVKQKGIPVVTVTQGRKSLP
jgi:peptidoglycan/xylan/chitin deacetylase (PgdA/CDA1 family)